MFLFYFELEPHRVAAMTSGSLFANEEQKRAGS